MFFNTLNWGIIKNPNLMMFCMFIIGDGKRIRKPLDTSSLEMGGGVISNIMLGILLFRYSQCNLIIGDGNNLIANTPTLLEMGSMISYLLHMCSHFIANALYIIGDGMQDFISLKL